MNISISWLSGLLFAAGSLVFLVFSSVYRYYFGAVPEGWNEELLRVMNDWEVISFIWGGELAAVVLITWSALNLAKRNRFWNLVAIGHLLMLVKYVVLLGGYPVLESEEMYRIINRLAILVFAVANLLWIIGMAGLYAHEEGWVGYAGATTAAIAGGLFALSFSGGLTVAAAGATAPLILVMYLLNVLYGIRISVNGRYSRR